MRTQYEYIVKCSQVGQVISHSACSYDCNYAHAFVCALSYPFARPLYQRNDQINWLWVKRSSLSTFAMCHISR